MHESRFTIMKALPKYFGVFAAAFLAGLAAVFIWLSISNTKTSADNPPPALASEAALINAGRAGPEVKTTVEETPEEVVENPNPLEKIWEKDNRLLYKGYKISKECDKFDDDYANCWLRVRKNGKVLAAIEAEYTRDYWMRFGLFNFLGEKDKQLVVFTYSGGAHCCYDYLIYDLDPGFRKIYDSTPLDAANDIGNELFPVDINKDGVYEFRRHAMAFQDFYFPPAIFEYDKNRRQYRIANRKFGDFVMSEREQIMQWYEKEKKRARNESEEVRLTNDRDTVRALFLTMVYADREAEAWKYLDENDHYDDRERFRKDAKSEFISDVTYRSIYPPARAKR
jgi:hypothetical protein